MSVRSAKLIRGVTVPPVMAGIVVLLLFFLYGGIFRHAGDMLVMLFALSLLPLLAYPLQPLLPYFKKKGQKGKRTLAFVLSILSYFGLAVYAFAAHTLPDYRYIATVYLASVLLLVVFNKLSPYRASGHACSVTGPMLFLGLYLGWYAAIPAALAFALILVSSVVLGRHTVTEFLLGSLCAVSSAALMLLFFTPAFL